MPPTHGAYRIQIQGEWTLEDLYVFPRAYAQVYFLTQSLFRSGDERWNERLAHAYRSFPWQGGYSAVNFYNELKFLLPPRERPQVVSIRYESPGWIELGLVVAGALAVEKFVKSVSRSVGDAHDTYHQIVKGLSERKLLRLEVKRKELDFKKTELEYIKSCAATTAELLGLPSANAIDEKTGHPYLTLKILLSLYRRVKTLSDYERKGKATFSKRR
jgi:hypothetical protein